MKSRRRNEKPKIKPEIKQISRETFVMICHLAILQTRVDLTIGNQISGYKKYHKPVKNNYVKNTLRNFLDEREKKFGFSLFNAHKAIGIAQVGFCNECALYAWGQIDEMLSKREVAAFIMKVSADRPINHAFLRIQITLKNEQPSEWEVDAWDPRIIDVTSGLDGEIKNEELLGYGKIPVVHRYMHTLQDKKNGYYLSMNELIPAKSMDELALEKQKIESESESLTDDEEMFIKNKKWLYGDYTLDDAYEKGLLPKDGILTAFQEVSEWQIEQKPKIEPKQRNRPK